MVLASSPSPVSEATASPSPSSSSRDLSDLDALRELRVVLPTEMHRKLRSLKLLRGRNIGDSVAEALEAYFNERPELPSVSSITRHVPKSD